MTEVTERGVSTPAQTVWVAPSLDALLEQLEKREAFKHSDSLSGSRFEWVWLRGERMLVKYLSVDEDWIMRATGELDSRLLRLLASGVMSRMPQNIDSTMVAAAPVLTEHGHRGAALLMRDVGEWLVPPGIALIGRDTHERFIDHMAELHAALWGYEDSIDLIPLAHHFTILTPVMAALEAERGGDAPVPIAVAQGWDALRHIEPQLARTLDALAADPWPLVSALQSSPSTFVHADWKLGNLGEHPDGRTILLDWDRCGAGPATMDLAWYLAVNCDRMPQSKEATIDAYRAALTQHGVDTDGWWDAQFALTLIGAALQMSWAKTHDRAELGWWRDRVLEGERFLA